jgi:parallel beta-helix repeat protein
MRRSSRFTPLVRTLFPTLLTLSALAACGDDGGTSTGSGGAGGAGGGSGGSEPSAACAGIDTSACAVALGPSSDDTTAVQTALIEAQSGSTICLCPGTYSFENELSLTVPGVTVRGVGATRDDVVLDFGAQVAGDDGFTVTADNFTVEHLSVKNSPGNGIVVTGAENVVFRDLKVSWDAGSVTENGAYAVYPVKCNKVIVEDCEVIGAADAGVYVGQSKLAIVRNNVVHGNVAGIEFENTIEGEAYGNDIYDNAAGILVFALPNLDEKISTRTNVHDNTIHDNNRDNFAEPGTVVATVPPGIGFLNLAADDVEIHANDFKGNVTAAIAVASVETFCVLDPGSCGANPDPATDPDPEGLYVYANTFSDNGAMPNAPLDLLPTRPIEDVLWDGVEKTAGSIDLCLSMSPPSFRNFKGIPNIGTEANQTTDTTPYLCEGIPQSPLEW